MHKENTGLPREERHVREGVATRPGGPRGELVLHRRPDVRPQRRDREPTNRPLHPIAVLCMRCNHQLHFVTNSTYCRRAPLHTYFLCFYLHSLDLFFFKLRYSSHKIYVFFLITLHNYVCMIFCDWVAITRK